MPEFAPPRPAARPAPSSITGLLQVSARMLSAGALRAALAAEQALLVQSTGAGPSLPATCTHSSLILPHTLGASLQSIPQSSKGAAFSSFSLQDPPPLPRLPPAGPQVAHLLPSRLTAGGGLSQAMAALEGACMSEMPFSLLVPLEGGHAEQEAGGEAEELAADGGDEGAAAAADVAEALEALGCGPLHSAHHQGAAAGEPERGLMPPPPPRPVASRQPPPAGLSREQLAAAVLAATEAAHPSAAGWGTSGAEEGMADSFGDPAPQALPPEQPASSPAGPPGGTRRSCRLAVVPPAAAAPAGLMAGGAPTWRMHQVRRRAG